MIGRKDVSKYTHFHLLSFANCLSVSSSVISPDLFFIIVSEMLRSLIVLDDPPGIRLARATHVNHRQLPTSDAIIESVDLAHEIYCRVFRKVPERLERS